MDNNAIYDISSDEPSFKLGHNRALDGLRGFAVLIVMGSHYKIPFMDVGYVGVDIFFVLSGFLITYLLLEEWKSFRSINLKRFYVHRFLRLYPALLVMVVCFGKFFPFLLVISILTYWSNWLLVSGFQIEYGFIGHIWSLSVEEQYYLFWPIILTILLNNLKPKKVLLITIGLGILSAINRYFVWYYSNHPYRFYMSTDTRADGLLLGSAFAIAVVFRLFVFNKEVRSILSFFTPIAILLSLWGVIERPQTEQFLFTTGFFWVSIFSLIIIAQLTIYPVNWLKTLFENKYLAFIGNISYGIYLWHYPIGYVIDSLKFPINEYLILSIKLLITFFIVIVSYRYIEKPILRLKNKSTNTRLSMKDYHTTV